MEDGKFKNDNRQLNAAGDEAASATGGQQHTSDDVNQEANGDPAVTKDDIQDRKYPAELAHEERPEDDDTNSSDEGHDVATDQSSDAVPLATGKKPRKKPRKKPAARTVTPERREELTFMIHEIVDSLPERGTFDALSFSKKQNLALDLVKDIYMEASNDFDKLVKYKDKPESKGLVISQKSNLMLKIENFKKLNKGRADAKQFKIGDQFEIKADGDSIILTRISSASHAA